jgi:hypothetical protein
MAEAETDCNREMTVSVASAFTTGKDRNAYRRDV